MRRGTKEMDLILIRYSDHKLSTMSPEELDVYEAFLNENDQDLYQWVSGQVPAKGEFSKLVADIVSVLDDNKPQI
jgi:antitoxin CptB